MSTQNSGEHLKNRRSRYDLECHTPTVDGEPVRLTPTETKIVELLMRTPTDISRRRLRARMGESHGVEKHGYGAHPPHPGED